MGGVQRYTPDGSHGTPDGFGNEFVHASGQSGEFTPPKHTDAERRMEKQLNSWERVVQNVSGAEFQLLDIKQLTPPQQETAKAAHRAYWSRAARRMDVDAPIGEKYMEYWMWLCRETQNDWSSHPLGIPNKKIIGSNLDYQSNLLGENTIGTVDK